MSIVTLFPSETICAKDPDTGVLVHHVISCCPGAKHVFTIDRCGYGNLYLADVSSPDALPPLSTLTNI